MPIVFPVEPNEGDLFASGSKKYIYSSGGWRIYINNAPQNDLFTPWSSIKDAPKVFSQAEVNTMIQQALTLALANVALKSDIPNISDLALKSELPDVSLLVTKVQFNNLLGTTAPETLDQISELAAAINNDPSYGTHVLTAIAAIPYDLADYVSGKPTAGNLNSFIVSLPIKFVAGMTNSVASAEVAATAATTFAIQKNGVTFASFTFAAGATIATFTCATETTLASKDIVTIVAPTADATLSGIRYTLSAKLA